MTLVVVSPFIWLVLSAATWVVVSTPTWVVVSPTMSASDSPLTCARLRPAITVVDSARICDEASALICTLVRPAS